MLSATQTLVFALGGLEEVGLNALVVETDRDLILVDCGLLFPPPSHPGIDYMVPDFGYLRARREKFRGVLLSHGHEDHIGAVAQLLAEVRVPVYGTRFTLALLRDRLAERGGCGLDSFHTVVPGGSIALGEIRAEFIRVSHSIPDACALALTTAGGSILHSGDFTMDAEPVADRRTDLEALRRWGDLGVDLLCCDSTNALCPGSTPSEAIVAEGLVDVLRRIEGRAYVALFSSHVARMQQTVEASRHCGRRVTALGRAVTRCARLARQYGYLRTAPGDWVVESHSRGVPLHALTVLAGGSQGEPGSAMWRVSRGEEPHYRLQPGDGVVFSARVIPGSEVRVHEMLNRCVEAGARVFMGPEDGVHVSGHPSAADVQRMFELTRPRNVLPVHGELTHREGLARLAARAGMSPEQILLARNGRAVLLDRGHPALGPSIPVPRICLQGNRMLAADDPVFAVRRRMGDSGTVAVFLSRQSDGAVAPRVVLAGVCSATEQDGLTQSLEAALKLQLNAILEKRAQSGRRREDPAVDLRDTTRRLVQRYFRREGFGRPYVCVESA